MDDLSTLMIGYLALRAMAEYQDRVVPAIEQKGAELYERTHPAEKKHKNDLPGKQIPRNTIFAMVKKYGFFQPDVATAIVLAESGGVPNALGDNGISVGLFQINTRAWPQYTREYLSNPINNLEAAYQISKGGVDWRPWSTYKNGTYLKYL